MPPTAQTPRSSRSPSSRSPSSRSPSSRSPSSRSPSSRSPSTRTRRARAASKLQRSFRKARTRGFCSICFSYYAPSPIISLKCGHKFHQKCKDDWFKRNRSCPVCRVVYRKDPLENEDTRISPEERIRDRQTMERIRQYANAMAARPVARSAARPLARAAARRDRTAAIGVEASMSELVSADRKARTQAANRMTDLAQRLLSEATAEIQSGYAADGKMTAILAITNAQAAIEEASAIVGISEEDPILTQALTIKREAENLLRN